MTTKTIHVGSHRLSDGSRVFNVYLGVEDINPVAACSEIDARLMADGIADLIKSHSVTDVRVHYWRGQS